MSKNNLIQRLRQRAKMYPLWADICNEAADQLEASTPELWAMLGVDNHADAVTRLEAIMAEGEVGFD